MSTLYSSRFALPSAWEPRAAGRSQHANSCLKIDGLKLKHSGCGDDEPQPAAVRANHPIPPDCPLFYFEVEVVNGGQDCSIAVGFAGEDVPLSKLPGYDPHSYGYHAGDGQMCSAFAKISAAFGPQYGQGDVIGALLNRSDRSIAFFKNGVDLGIAFEDVQEEPLFPSVGLKFKDEELRASFGVEPFVTDFVSLQQNFRRKVYNSIRQVSLPTSSLQGEALVPHLVFEYLVHNCCWQTAAKLARDTLPDCVQLSGEQVKEVSRRKQITAAIIEGNTDEALRMTIDAYGNEFFLQNPRIHFKIRCQKFIQMISRKDDILAALQFGRRELTDAIDADVELLRDAVTLLAYKEPESSPSGHLLGCIYRKQLAEELNSALLVFRGKPQRCALEQEYKQLVCTLDELKCMHEDWHGNPRAAVINIQSLHCGDLSQSPG